MTTLISVKVGDQVVSKCSRRCYNGPTSEECNCICCGLLHGLGESQAANRALDLLDLIINCATSNYGLDAVVVCHVQARQLHLFTLKPERKELPR